MDDRFAIGMEEGVKTDYFIKYLHYFKNSGSIYECPSVSDTCILKTLWQQMKID